VKKELKINWKRPEDMRRYISDSGGIFPRRKTGLCAKHQRRVAIAVKRARHMSLLPYTSEHVRVMGLKNS
jgi:small subunit ribosomal protein S18